ncbi:hypothetical protein C8J56DRAFT_1063058 [Mycena floridula]|nr:hypothetical protein C8J56DRAFT_1063058 [Mycena floridula]
MGIVYIRRLRNGYWYWRKLRHYYRFIFMLSSSQRSTGPPSETAGGHRSSLDVRFRVLQDQPTGTLLYRTDPLVLPCYRYWLALDEKSKLPSSFAQPIVNRG